MIEVEDEIRVLIEDRGKGFVDGASTDGFGLLGMRERVVLAGGTLAVSSAPDAGTTITARLPAEYRTDAGRPDRSSANQVSREESGPAPSVQVAPSPRCSGQPGEPLHQARLGPPAAETERVAGTGQGETDQDQRVDDVVVEEEVVFGGSAALHINTTIRAPAPQANRMPMPRISRTPIVARPTMNSASTNPAPAMLW